MNGFRHGTFYRIPPRQLAGGRRMLAVRGVDQDATPPGNPPPRRPGRSLIGWLLLPLAVVLVLAAGIVLLLMQAVSRCCPWLRPDDDLCPDCGEPILRCGCGGTDA